MYYVGIDISKRSFTVSILDDAGEMVKSPFTFPVNQKGLAKLLDILKGISEDKDKIHVGMEATGSLWENIYSFLEEKGYTLFLINPHQSRKFHELARRKAKTDKVDSVVIAGLLRSGETIRSYVPENDVQSLRELVRLRHSLQKTRKNYQRRALSLLEVVFPEYLQLVKNPFGEVSCMILTRYPTAFHMREAKASHLVKICRRIKGNNYSGELAYRLIEAAKNSIYSGKACRIRGESIRILLEEIKSLKEKIERIDKQIDDILSSKEPPSPEEHLLEIPGVGPKTVATFIGEVGDVARFKQAKELIGFIGFHPTISESGKRKNQHPKMSRKGSPTLRAALYMASISCIKHNRELRALYLKKISQGKKPKQALICVGKKLACIMYSMLKNGTSYDPQRVFTQA